jgi:hypothetical protein
MENQLNFISVAITLKNNARSLWSIKTEVFKNNELNSIPTAIKLSERSFYYSGISFAV